MSASNLITGNDGSGSSYCIYIATLVAIKCSSTSSAVPSFLIANANLSPHVKLLAAKFNGILWAPVVSMRPQPRTVVLITPAVVIAPLALVPLHCIVDAGEVSLEMPAQTGVLGSTLSP